jgi:hypothetical protein
MSNKLQRVLRRGTKPIRAAAAEGIREGMALLLPPGAIVAEQGVCHVPETGAARTVVPVLHEAYVVIQLNEHRRCYATWLPDCTSWDLLCLEIDPAAAGSPASLLPAAVAARYGNSRS